MAEPVAHVPVPSSVTALYAVLTTESLESDGAPPPVPPVSLLLARGTSPDTAQRVSELPCATAVTRDTDPDEAFENERAAVRAALDLASRHDGIVLDARVPRVVASEPVDRYRSADWFVFEHTDETIETHGLTRFGVPELRCQQVPAARFAMYDAVLVGAAQRVVEEWPVNDPVGPATITMRDIARGYGDASAGGDDPTLARHVDVTLAYDRDAHRLDVTLHDDPAEALFADE